MRISFCCSDTKPQPWLDGLKAAFPDAEVSLWSPGAELADYAVVWAPPQQFFDEQTRIKGIFNIGAGVDALMELRLPAGVPVVRLDDAGMSAQMAEFVCHAVIRHFRELDGYEADIAQGKWSYRKPRLRADYPVGVMGLGVLGERVSRALSQFDFPVNGWSRSPKTVEGVQCFSGDAGGQGFQDFLAASRILVCLLPLTPATEGIMNLDTLSRLRPGGYVINVARGSHLVEGDLITLIDNGHLAGAALDVFRTEPLPTDHPFWKHPKITVTPHTSARTLREESIAQIAVKVRAVERGEQVAGIVDPQRGY